MDTLYIPGRVGRYLLKQAEGRTLTSSAKKTVLFAHPRTGSSSLTNVLNLHPQLNLALDPFWHGYGAAYPDERNYVDDIDDIPSLERALQELFARYNGMMVHDYQLEEDVYDHLLLKPGIRVIFLQRRNLLRAEISSHIAEQTKVWGMNDMNEERREIYRNLAPIPPKALSESLVGCYKTRTVF